jgi:hypothetical protein
MTHAHFVGRAAPLWGQEPYRSMLPKLLHSVATDVLSGSAKIADIGTVATVGLMPDESIAISLSAHPAVPPWIARNALAWISVRAGEHAGEESVLHDFSSPALAGAPVSAWLQSV